MSAKLHTVHVRVNDAATGHPTPCRVRFTDAEGNYYAPFGRLTEFAIGNNVDVGGNLYYGDKKYAYIDGTCEIQLPAAPIRVEVFKGPEFWPIDQETTLGPGKLAVRLTLTRWSDVRRDGWYPGDTRAHYLTPHAALLEGVAEDLSVVNLLAQGTQVVENEDPFAVALFEPHAPPTCAAIPNILAFSGQKPAVQSANCLVVVNTHNCHPRLGAVSLLNCHRLVFPLSFGFKWLDQEDDWTFADWCDQCHRKGGLVVWTETALSVNARSYGEPLADMILGKVDAVEVVRFPWQEDPSARAFNWYGVLNCGFRLALTGASEKQSNVVPLGAVRTYAKLREGEDFKYRNWVEAIRAGRTFATNGPMLFMTANGQGPGATLNLESSAPAVVQVQAEARSIVPFEYLEIVANGSVVASAGAEGQPFSASIEAEIPMPDGGWLAARCRGGHHLPGYFLGQFVYAHTSPVYVERTGQRYRIDQVALGEFLAELDTLLKWVNEKAFCDENHRERLANIFRSARQELLKRSTV